MTAMTKTAAAAAIALSLGFASNAFAMGAGYPWLDDRGETYPNTVAQNDQGQVFAGHPNLIGTTQDPLRVGDTAPVTVVRHGGGEIFAYHPNVIGSREGTARVFAATHEGRVFAGDPGTYAPARF